MTNPLVNMGGGDSEASTEPSIDATSDEGLSELEGLGIPIKRF